MNCFEYCGVADLASHDPRDLRLAAMLIEVNELAAEIARLGRITTDVCTSVDGTLAYVIVHTSDEEYLEMSDAARLRDTLRNLPGTAGLERFFGKAPASVQEQPCDACDGTGRVADYDDDHGWGLIGCDDCAETGVKGGGA